MSENIIEYSFRKPKPIEELITHVKEVDPEELIILAIKGGEMMVMYSHPSNPLQTLGMFEVGKQTFIEDMKYAY
jgi:hypothetical protein